MATKVLANLDDDDAAVNGLYAKPVYLLYPEYRQKASPKVDVIIVHGLLGGVFFTWRQQDRDQGSTIGLFGKRNEKSSSTPTSSDGKDHNKKKQT